MVLATIKRGDTPAQITPFLQDEPHMWKICQWHQNQAAMQVGGKTDEMGWEVYEACRKMGAIVPTGHEHSYSRTKTLTDITKQTVDPGCGSATELCVGPGRTFVNVVGLGGQSIESDRPSLRLFFWRDQPFLRVPDLASCAEIPVPCDEQQHGKGIRASRS